MEREKRVQGEIQWESGHVWSCPNGDEKVSSLPTGRIYASSACKLSTSEGENLNADATV